MVGSGQAFGRLESARTCCAPSGKSLALSEARFPAHQRWANDRLGRQQLLGRGGGALIGWLQGRGDGKLATRGGRVLLWHLVFLLSCVAFSELGREQPERGEERRPLGQDLASVVSSIKESGGAPSNSVPARPRAPVYKGLRGVSPSRLPATASLQFPKCSAGRIN